MDREGVGGPRSPEAESRFCFRTPSRRTRIPAPAVTAPALNIHSRIHRRMGVFSKWTGCQKTRSSTGPRRGRIVWRAWGAEVGRELSLHLRGHGSGGSAVGVMTPSERDGA